MVCMEYMHNGSATIPSTLSIICKYMIIIIIQIYTIIPNQKDIFYHPITFLISSDAFCSAPTSTTFALTLTQPIGIECTNAQSVTPLPLAIFAIVRPYFTTPWPTVVPLPYSAHTQAKVGVGARVAVASSLSPLLLAGSENHS